MRSSLLGGQEGDNAPVSSSPPAMLSRTSALRPSHLHPHGHGHTTLPPSPVPRSPFLLDDDPYPMAARGPGTLSTLLRNRSATSLHHPVPQSAWRTSFSWAADDEFGDALAASSDRPPSSLADMDAEDRRMSAILMAPNMRSMRLIGNSNPRYRWARYWKSEEELQHMNKPLRQYYERTNYLVQQYMYIDRLLDSSLPHDLLNEYNDMPSSHFRGVEIPDTIKEAEERARSNPASPLLTYDSMAHGKNSNSGTSLAIKKVKRTPKDIYRPSETTPLFNNDDYSEEEDNDEHNPQTSNSRREPFSLGPPGIEDGDTNSGDLEAGQSRRKRKPLPQVPNIDDEDEEIDSGDRIVAIAIYVNFAANIILLAGKIAVIATVPSMSVLASLVDAVLDFLSTAIVWTTTWLVSHRDQYRYPVGRRRLEPLGVLVFSIIMITSFVQVSLESIQRLWSPEHTIIHLGIPAIAIMIGTVVIKGCVWLWCRLIRNSSVRALADDAVTDVIFNTGSIIFPIVGFYAGIWWLDAAGGLLLSLVVIKNWSQTSAQHIKNLSGFSATADQRNILLYLTMRFAKTIKQIQGLQAYHAGDKLNVEVDIVLDASTPLKDSHDLAESLGYVLESVPIVDRAFVHCDYASWNLPTHMSQ